MTRMKDETALHFLKEVEDLDVDMTKYLASTEGSEYSDVQKRLIRDCSYVCQRISGTGIVANK